MNPETSIAILGAGNIGTAIARGLEKAGYRKDSITLTRRKAHRLAEMKGEGFSVTPDNREAVRSAGMIFLTVEPQQINPLLNEIRGELDPRNHIVVSVVTGISIRQINHLIKKKMTIIRAMPNTAIAVQSSMTCLSSNGYNPGAIERVKEIFDTVGKTLIIDEEQMNAATALGACGVAFFLRAVRASSQGGIEIGFHSKEALMIAAQTAKGAASLLLSNNNHPEREIDNVTTPKGCTISGLNRMEHEGFSSAMIKGITVSAEKAASLFKQ